ncbi:MULTISPECIES: AAA family ATPase [unclassified Acidovorax]|uniref:AAA family ATPase n=1 Tax=unclassified Acidovorax TaxID=2684926 RepID=UPI001C4430D6|nr:MULTISPECIES: AAA family ATPase [unclassified Acidovorax]MBV7427858.1 AAA family ATPase [Acidovorax sp. sif0732]MBV7450218.1 AAA family ATPase [Acidovorax sp. sif0715]
MTTFVNGPLSRELAMRFLGGFDISRGQEAVTAFPYDKVRALLAYLALEPGEHRREHLADLLWPQVDAERARANLRGCLFDLRRALGDAQATATGSPPLIEASQKTLRLRAGAGCHLDVADFLAGAGVPVDAPALLEQRVAHYRGPLLAGLYLPDAPEFEAWLAARREGLHRQALDMLERLVAHHELQGHGAKALQYAQRAIEVDPWREPLQRSYLRLLARRSPSAALTHYAAYRRAIAQELGAEPEPQTVALVERIGAAAAPHSPRPEGLALPERRRLAVLACDFEPRDGMDPEDAAAALAGLLEQGSGLVRGYAGHVVAAQGGELLAFFGYPSAREHAPRDAAQAALALVQTWRAAACAADLVPRVGLHAGWAFVAESQGPPDAAGTLTRTARRMAQAAPAGGVLASAALRGILEAHFQWGSAQEGAAVLLARRQAMRRGDAEERPASPLVGRRQELDRLLAAWGDAQRGRQVGVLLRADAGKGKSRLAAALAQQVRACGGRVAEVACQAESAHIPYFPFVEQLQRQMGPDHGTPADAHQGAVQAAVQVLQELGTEAALAELPVLLHLLGLPMDPGIAAAAQPLYPAQRKEREQHLLARLFGPGSDGRPLLLVVEDLHWADQATSELLERMLAPDRDAPLLLLCTTRAQPHGPLAARLAVQLELAPLSYQSIRALVTQLEGGTRLGDSQMASIVGRADGVPLYAEELARAALAGGAGHSEVPATLWDALAARLDGMGPAKRIAQYAACIGRDFGEDLLRAIAGPQDDVGGGLEVLQHAGVVRRRLGGPLYFRHALIRQAAYESLAQAERRRLHARLAEALRTDFSERVRAYPAILAHHLSESIHPAAAHAWWVAGTQAASRSVLGEAIHDFYAGLAAVQALPEDDPGRARDELLLQVGLGTALVGAQGYGSDAARDCFHRAWALAASAPPGMDLFPLMWGLWMVGRHSEDEHPLEYADRLARMAAGSADPARRMAVEYAYGNNTLWLGEFARSRGHLEAAIGWSTRVGSAESIARFGEDIGIAARALLAWVHWIEGDLPRARALADDNVALARTLGHAHSFGFAFSCAAVLYRHLRDPEHAAALSAELLAYAQHHRLLLWQAAAAAVLGWAQAVQGDARALTPIREGLEGARQVFRVIEITFMAFLIDALLHLGRGAEALPAIDEALHKAAAHHDTHFVAELLRLRGDALLQLRPSDTAPALRLYRDALARSEACGAALFALRSATRIARLLAAQGACGEAAALLEPALARVSDLPGNPDLHEARECLAQCTAAAAAMRP